MSVQSESIIATWSNPGRRHFSAMASTQLISEGSSPGRELHRAGARARVGVILPSVNTVVEPWFNVAAPPGVAMHATRMLLDNAVTPETLRRMDEEEGVPAAVRLAGCRPAAIAYCCTASSVVQGLDYDRELAVRLSAAAGCACITAVGAIVDALNVLRVRRVTMVSPYTDVIDRAEHALFRSAGFAVTGHANLGISDGFGLAAPSPAEISALVHRALANDAEAIVISCLNLNSQAVAAELEAATTRPVVTSTTATLWKLLRTAGIDDPVQGYGRLLSHH